MSALNHCVSIMPPKKIPAAISPIEKRNREEAKKAASERLKKKKQDFEKEHCPDAKDRTRGHDNGTHAARRGLEKKAITTESAAYLQAYM